MQFGLHYDSGMRERKRDSDGSVLVCVSSVSVKSYLVLAGVVVSSIQPINIE